jgi:hypothetical protein
MKLLIMIAMAANTGHAELIGDAVWKVLTPHASDVLVLGFLIDRRATATTTQQHT